jgi:protein gp37
VFCASLSDWLDAEVPIEWLADLLDLIRRTPNLDWLLLSKRPQNWRQRLESVCEIDGDSIAFSWLRGTPPANVWIGTTVEDQERANERIPQLLSIPARVRFLSCEPLLGALDLVNAGGIALAKPPRREVDWVIIGGESGPTARDFCLEHAHEVIRQCQEAGVPVFVKQFGAFPITTNANLYDWPDETTLEQHGTEAAGARVILRDRNGRDLSEWPEEFQLQEFPAEHSGSATR